MAASSPLLLRRERSAAAMHREHDQQDLARGSKWIYAMQTCGKPTYVAQLESQLRTWAANANVEERLLIIGGPHDNGQGQLACSDGPDGQLCKEATVLYRSAIRAEELGADWLLHVIDDAYIVLPRLWKALESFNPADPAVFSDIGCGRSWKYAPENTGAHSLDGGESTKPKGWVEPDYSCETVSRHGGICTAAGYVVSRGALNLLRQNHTLQSFVEDYRGHTNFSAEASASDLASSCLFYSRGVALREWPHGARMVPGSEYAATDVLKDTDIASVHVELTPKARITEYMLELHDVFSAAYA